MSCCRCKNFREVFAVRPGQAIFYDCEKCQRNMMVYCTCPAEPKCKCCGSPRKLGSKRIWCVENCTCQIPAEPKLIKMNTKEAQCYATGYSDGIGNDKLPELLKKILEDTPPEPERVSDEELRDVIERLEKWSAGSDGKVLDCLQELQKYRRGECRSCGAIPGQLHDKTCPTQNHPQAQAG